MKLINSVQPQRTYYVTHLPLKLQKEMLHTVKVA